MTPQEAAEQLDGCEYGSVGSKELFTTMKAAGLVAIHGYSDDVVVLDGAISDEAYPPALLFDRRGLLAKACDDDRCPHEAARERGAVRVEAHWCATEAASWTYSTDLPHATFRVLEDEDVYCVGLVISLEDVARAWDAKNVPSGQMRIDLPRVPGASLMIGVTGAAPDVTERLVAKVRALAAELSA